MNSRPYRWIGSIQTTVRSTDSADVIDIITVHEMFPVFYRMTILCKILPVATTSVFTLFSRPAVARYADTSIGKLKGKIHKVRRTQPINMGSISILFDVYMVKQQQKCRNKNYLSIIRWKVRQHGKTQQERMCWSSPKLRLVPK